VSFAAEEIMRLATTLRLGALAAAGAGAIALVRRARHRTEHRTNPIVVYTVTINRPPQQVYDFFRRFDRLPQVMDYLDSVTEDGDRSHWVARLPIGKLSWDAILTEEIPARSLAWRTVPGSLIVQRGRVTFTQAPGRESTEVRVEFEVGLRGMQTSRILGKLVAKPQIKGDLRRLKQVLETGEVLVSDASVKRMPHAAQPSEHVDREPGVFIPHRPTAQKGVSR
jgi:uncharacterized membrane protein